MPQRYKKHIFICVNEREPNHPKGSCANCGARDIRLEFVKLINKNGLKGVIRANKSGCLDACEFGPTIVIYPDNIWYTKVKLEDVDEIFNKTILKNEAVTRLAAGNKTWQELCKIRKRRRNMRKITTFITALALILGFQNQKLMAADSYKEIGFISGNRGSGLRMAVMWKFKPGYEYGITGRFYDIKNEGELPVRDFYTGQLININDKALIFIPIMFSLKYHPFEGKIANNFSPFMIVNFGPNLAIDGIESERKFKKKWIKAPTIVTLGGNVSLGLDFLLQGGMNFSISMGYDFFPMGKIVDGRRNYDGFLLKIGISKARI